jgi:hypothetical protein
MQTWCKLFEQPRAHGTLGVPTVAKCVPYDIIASKPAARVLQTRLFPAPGDHVDKAATLKGDPHAESASVAAKVRPFVVSCRCQPGCLLLHACTRTCNTLAFA